MPKTIRQMTIHNKNGDSLTVRYDVESQLLYRQNRSYDRTMSLDCFLDQLTNTRKEAKKRGLKFVESRVEKGAKW